MYEFYLGQKDFLHGYVSTKYGMQTRIYALILRDLQILSNFVGAVRNCY